MDLKPIGLRTTVDGNTLLDQVTELAIIGGVVVVGAVAAQQLLIGYTAKKASDVAAPVINTIVEAIDKPKKVAEKVADGAENTAKIVKDALKEPEVQKKVIPPVSDLLNPLIPGPAMPVKIISDAVIDAITPGSSPAVDDSPSVDYTPGYDAPYAYDPNAAKDAFEDYFDLEPAPVVEPVDNGLNIEVDVIEAIDKPKKRGGSSGGGKSIGKATIVVSEDRYKDDLRKSIEKDESYGSSSGDMVKIIFGL